MAQPPFRVLFVCMGNICRSPAGDNVFRHLVRQTGLADQAKINPFTAFCSAHDLPEVPDPYYGGDAGFELVADLMEDGCANLLEHLRKSLT